MFFMTNTAEFSVQTDSTISFSFGSARQVALYSRSLKMAEFEREKKEERVLSKKNLGFEGKKLIEEISCRPGSIPKLGRKHDLGILRVEVAVSCGYAETSFKNDVMNLKWRGEGGV